MLSRGFKSFRSWTMIIVLRFNEGEEKIFPSFCALSFGRAAWEGVIVAGVLALVIAILKPLIFDKVHPDKVSRPRLVAAHADTTMCSRQ